MNEAEATIEVHKMKHIVYPKKNLSKFKKSVPVLCKIHKLLWNIRGFNNLLINTYFKKRLAKCE